MKTISKKWQLKLQDVKSWLITNLLILGPILVTTTIEYFMGQDYGEWTKVAMILLGSLLKLAQKWQKTNTYQQ